MADTVTLTIDGQKIEAQKGTTILDVAKKANINIPHLCYYKGLSVEGSCRVCVVEIDGRPRLEPSCATEVVDGMNVKTNTPRVRRARRMIVELLIASHAEECLTCEKSQSCELEKLSHELGVRKVRFERVRKYLEPDVTSPSLSMDLNKCILCGRCVRTCQEIQSVGVYDFVHRGKWTKISTAFERGLGNVECVCCGQCILACPTGTIYDNSTVDEVWRAISDTNKFTIVQTAPAVRFAIGEEFGMAPDSLVTGKMAAALRRLGFDKVFDTQFAADLVINEEASKFIEMIKSGAKFPGITSCSPAWIKYIEHFFPDCLEHLCSCKSPQQVFGSVAKTYYCEKMGIRPEDMYVVSVMPCTAKKFEARRPEMCSAFEYWLEKGVVKEGEKFPDVDAVLTTRELARIVKEAGIDFVNLPEEDFDAPLGISSGAGVLFGATGGVTEAALRTTYEWYTNKKLERVEFEGVRGMQGIRSTTVSLDGLELKVAVAHGLSNARILLEEVQKGVSPYHFIEIMACPGGCLGGGGQPIPTNLEIIAKRASALYKEDIGKPIRKSHENPAIKTLYEEYLDRPGSEKAHRLLHTTYTKRRRW